MVVLAALMLPMPCIYIRLVWNLCKKRSAAKWGEVVLPQASKDGWTDFLMKDAVVSAVPVDLAKGTASSGNPSTQTPLTPGTKQEGAVAIGVWQNVHRQQRYRSAAVAGVCPTKAAVCKQLEAEESCKVPALQAGLLTLAIATVAGCYMLAGHKVSKAIRTPLYCFFQVSREKECAMPTIGSDYHPT